MSIFRYTEAVDCAGSSNLDYIYYNENNNTLCVQFLSGSVVGYREVPKVLWDRFKTANSFGVFYNAWVKHKFHGLGIDFDDFEQVEVPKTGLDAVTPQPSDFVVKGTVTVQRTYRVATMEEAVKRFQSDYSGATATEVTVKF